MSGSLRRDAVQDPSRGFVAIAPQTGYYVEVSPRGVRTGGGCYWFEPPRPAAFRAAVAHDTYGADLGKRLATATRKGYEVGGETLKTKPRGYDADHPRIDRPSVRTQSCELRIWCHTLVRYAPSVLPNSLGQNAAFKKPPYTSATLRARDSY